MQSCDQLTVMPIAHATGVVALPGSKSISNRALLMAALAHGTTRLTGLLLADDTERMMDSLEALGVKIERSDTTVTVTGCGGRFPNTQADLFVGNAGTAARMLTAVLAFSQGDYRIDGIARMRVRPIADLLEALRALGANVTCEIQEGFLPLRFAPALVTGDLVTVKGNVSSQYLTALLIAAPLIAPPQGLVVEVTGELISRPYVDMTVRMMRRFGARIEPLAHTVGWRVFSQMYQGIAEYAVEADASGASYFLALGALAGGPVSVTGVGEDSLQGDVAFADVLERMGAKVFKGPRSMTVRREGHRRLRGITLDCTEIPDAAMTLVPMALVTDSPVRLTGIGSWRVKETDRLEAMAAEMRKFGASVALGPDWIEVWRPSNGVVTPATVQTYDDHRMAMSLSLAACAGVAVTVCDPGCTAKTFPTYFALLEDLVSQPTPRVTEPDTVPVIAIDGPTASGKGTVSMAVAQALGFHYLDSGALYRLAAYKSLKEGVSLDDEAGCAACTKQMRPVFDGQRIVLDAEDVSEKIRSEEVGIAASRVAAMPAVRAALTEVQRDSCTLPGLVADGRDMGSVIFPEAPLKVFLTASAQARAQRRFKQLIAKGISANLSDLTRDLTERDRRDRERKASPCVPAADAKILDSSDLNVEQTVEQILAWWRALQTAR